MKIETGAVNVIEKFFICFVSSNESVIGNGIAYRTNLESKSDLKSKLGLESRKTRLGASPEWDKCETRSDRFYVTRTNSRAKDSRVVVQCQEQSPEALTGNRLQIPTRRRA
ncbi:hypothetical protein EVAR_75174_1 [Eumeta japonica]|uniref:Uncharacterized protein n=1 Tax=Eumeta variegata TaxID=151549 RepID=A0A4C1U0L7_EUMVA|nr:hypothetical protein EVAR_75174_1 [Eumeta japonica]